jgi:UDP-glucose 4-epimerase
MERILVTGGAGFIGSHLVDRLVDRGYFVRVFDNLSSGSLKNIERRIGKANFEFVRGDLKDREAVYSIVKDIDTVFHLAANPEVRISSIEPEIHFRENIVATFNLLEAIRRSGGVEKLVFASSSTVYGDPEEIPTPETHIIKPISVYGASKAACEALISSYAHLYGFKAVSLRYANIVGPRLNHGVIYDFIMKLKRNPEILEVLGDGTQRKSYLYIDDAIDATLYITEKLMNETIYDVYNVGNKDWITVREIAEIVSRTMGLKPRIIYTGGTPDGRGWPGDVKYMLLSIEKLERKGWSPKYSSREAVELTAKALLREIGG